MKRRKFFQTAAVSAGVGAVVDGQQTPPTPAVIPGSPSAPVNAPGSGRGPAAPVELPKLETATPDDVGATKTGFFSPPQFAALRRLCEIILPPLAGSPGAIDAGAPEFLDFLVGASPAAKQKIYKTGLDLLNAAARKAHGKPFAELETAQAESVMAPLRKPWTFDAPADPLERFLKDAKTDIRTATMNSREYSASGGSRRFGGSGLYWYPLD